MQTMKLFFMAALALTFAACSSDDNDIQNPAQPAKAEGITITAKLAPKSGGAATRAVADKGDDKITVTWAQDEKIAILYEVSGTKYVAEANIDAVDGETGAATITFAVDGSTPDDTPCTLVYPAKLSDGTTTVYKDDLSGVKAYADMLATQDGVLDGDLDVRVGAGTIHIGPASLDVTTQPAAQYSIFKFTTQNISGTAITPSEFKVSDSEGNVITTVTLTTSAFYVALPALATGTYWFNATADSKPYIAKATVGTATSAGKFYSTTVQMATIGDVIKADGKFYAAGTSDAVAKIVFVGSDNGEAAPYNHGLALALSDASTASYWMTSPADAGHTTQNSDSFTSESGLQYNAMHNSEIDNYRAFKAAITYSPAAPTGCSAWFLASGYQWKKMAGAVGGYNNLGLEGGAYYWSSSEINTFSAWGFKSSDGSWSDGYKGYGIRVRACLAF